MVDELRRGVALPLVLVLLLALTFLGHGALLLSRRELQATWAQRHVIRATQATEIALRLSMSMPPDPLAPRDPWQPSPLLDGETPDGLSYSANRVWLDQEFFLVEAQGRSRGWKGTREAAWVGWSLYPAARVRAFLAAVEVGGSVSMKGASVAEGDGFLLPPEGWGGKVCGEYAQLLQELFPAGPLPVLSAHAGVEGNRGSWGQGVLGILSVPDLLRVLKGTAHEDGVFSEAGQGCPGSSLQPVVSVSPGDLALGEGEICGLVVTQGNLRLAGRVRFRGLALVQGDLTLEGEAVLEGMARVGGGLSLQDQAALRGSACPALRALTRISGTASIVPLSLLGDRKSNGFSEPLH